MHRQGVDHHEDYAHERDEEYVDEGVRQPFEVGSDLLQFAEGFAAALILEDAIRQFE
jgi:hypothetical protein